METAVAVATDWRTARLAPADHAMLEFTEKLTILPSAMTEEDVDALRRHGFDDAEVLCIVLGASSRNLTVRTADALGPKLPTTYNWPAEIVQAYGLTEAQMRSTFYEDRRATAAEERLKATRPQVAAVRPATAGHGSCWIDTTPSDSEHFARLCDELAGLMEPHSLRNLALAFGLIPEALEGIIAYGRVASMGGSGLGRRLEEIIGLVVGTTLGCAYMGTHHAQALFDLGTAPEEVRGIINDPAGESLPAQEREVARFSEKLTRRSGDMAESDVERLRSAGFDDRDILSIVACCSFENYLCRIPAGLGVQLEQESSFAPAVLEAVGS